MTSYESEPLLELDGITKRFGGTVALDSVSHGVCGAAKFIALSAKTAPASPR